jgi:hypothetical protein
MLAHPFPRVFLLLASGLDLVRLLRDVISDLFGRLIFGADGV